MSLDKAQQELIIADMRRWVERAVIGLNLCPFAKSVQSKEQVHYVVSEADTTAALRTDLERELQDLQAANPNVRDTTLLIVPRMLKDFFDFNDFLDEADAVLHDLKMSHDFQIASFHPQFQFAGVAADDITNYTNRAPYPALHLLREASVDRAVAAFPEAETIYERNMETLRRLGLAGWQALGVGADVGGADRSEGGVAEPWV